jgi:alcohol dehydrogenase
MSLPEYYEFICPTKIHSGNRALEHLPVELSAFGAEKPLVLTRRTTASDRKNLGTLISAFNDSTMVAGLFDAVPDPVIREIIGEVADIYNEKGHDAIIAMGNGSLVDCAKAVNILVSCQARNLGQFADGGLIDKPLQPLVIVPTGSGSGFETTGYATIGTLALESHHLIPQLVVIDHRVTGTENASDMITSGLTALSHAVEAYAGPQKNPLMDTYARAAISLVSRYLLETIGTPGSREGCFSLANASVMAGCAFANSGRGPVHDLGSAMAEVCELSPGICMGMVLPYALSHLEQRKEYKSGRLLLPFAGMDIYSETPEERRAGRVADILSGFLRDVGKAASGHFPVNLTDAGLVDHMFEQIAASASEKVECACSASDFITILKSADAGRPTAGGC